MKKTLLQQFIGEWNTKTIVGVAIGAALFGVLMVYGGVKVFSNTSLSTALLIPVIVGALFGPLPAFVACFLGNVLADTLGAWGYWWDWSIGNGVLGLLIGLLPLYGAKIALGKFTIKHAVIYSVIAILGNILAFGVITPIFTVLFYGGELTITLFQAQIAAYANSAVLIFLGLPLLYALALRNKSSQNLTKE